MIYDICIIGGGAAGMTAAITAKRRGAGTVVILEKKERPGKKILASGNGRCNLSNVRCDTWKDTKAFFHSLGLATRVNEAGLCYPYSEDSLSVVEALEGELKKLGVEVENNREVTTLTKEKEWFTIGGKTFEIKARKVLIAVGGKSVPKLGTTGDGAKLARSLGHRVSPLIPVLTGILVKDDMKDLAGVRQKGRVSLIFRGEEIFSEEGEIQFNREGLSGICMLNLSRYMMIPKGATLDNGFDDYEIAMDFAPDMGREEVEELLKTSPEDRLSGIVRPKLAAVLGRGLTDPAKAAEKVKDFRVRPKGVKGWETAQVTRGGVDLSQVNMETMESKIVEGLYFAGEVLDFDGPCGGFNLNFAWETGMKSGRGMTGGV